TMTNNPFDDRPDPGLGRSLRDYLENGLPASFTQRLLQRIPAAGSGLFDVLAAWARPGIAAALFFAALLGYVAVPMESKAAPGAVEALAADQPVDRDVVMGRVLGAER